MDATKQNYQIAREIIALLAKEHCTVRQSEEILSFVGTTIRSTSTVQCPEPSIKLFNCTENL